MKRLARNEGVGLRILLRMTVLALVIDANDCEKTTITPSSIASNQEGPTESSSTTSERAERESTRAPLALRLSTLSASTRQNQTFENVFEAMSNTTEPDESLQTIQEFFSEIRTFTMDTSTESSILDTTIWKWQFSWNWLTILQFIISLTGIVGNLLVVIIMGIRKSASNSTYIFIGALAVSDMLTSCLNIPIPRALQVPDSLIGRSYCSIIYTSSLSWVCVISSTYILVGASFERLAAVIYPLRMREIFTTRRIYIYIIVTWICSGLSCFQFLLSTFLSFKNPFLSRIYCGPPDSENISKLKILTLFNLFIRLLIPCVLMIISQIGMAISLHLQSRQLKGSMSSRGSKQPYHILARNRVIKMMLIVIILFILCWAPSQITFMVFSFRGSAGTYGRGTIRQILQLVTFLNSSVNPFIYAVNYRPFRSAIKNIFFGGTQKNQPQFGLELTQTTQINSANSEA